MDIDKLRDVFAVGETVAVEFKRCSDGIHSDTYETICSFLNRYGGDIYLGVEDDGSVSGVPANAAPEIIKNFIKMVSNPEIMLPTVYLVPEIATYKEKTLIHIHVPPSSEVHSYKRVIYDRVDDADVKVTATGQIANMYIRKQNIFTEKRVYPYVREDDLRLDMLPHVRQMAVNRYPGHPWKDLIEKDRMFVENANRAAKGGVVTLENYEPNPKNPIIASFFRNIGLADELGSGVRNLYKYGRRYSGGDPELIDGDVFRIMMPLDDGYSFDAETFKVQIKGNGCTLNCTLSESAILDFLRENPDSTQDEIAAATGKSLRSVKSKIAALKEKGMLERKGARKNGRWIVKNI
jgi:predicted HTH transcriptional regulator